MRVFDEKQTREQYLETQIQHSRKKFAFCKVSVACVKHWKKVITRCERNTPVKGPIRLIETVGMSCIEHIVPGSVVGVEINPDGKRRDVLTASFDELPPEWTGIFQIVYSNSLDHAQDPYRAAKEWYRVLADGGYLILGSPGEKIAPSHVGVVGNIGLRDIMNLFPGELIYYNKFGNAFPDAIIRKIADIPSSCCIN
ncbi:MAG TPA: methyltransferase domain-containing protein [Candidatus Omnitrophota bacterium]|nr:methyltransferase domain-containing protein [Candidatus Omnitrophota bacterium]HPN55670.1 methyltransferase domain-containing protein [Candidatus Omnitrophota bacterium]